MGDRAPQQIERVPRVQHAQESNAFHFPLVRKLQEEAAGWGQYGQCRYLCGRRGAPRKADADVAPLRRLGEKRRIRQINFNRFAIEVDPFLQGYPQHSQGAASDDGRTADSSVDKQGAHRADTGEVGAL